MNCDLAFRRYKKPKRFLGLIGSVIILLVDLTAQNVSLHWEPFLPGVTGLVLTTINWVQDSLSKLSICFLSFQIFNSNFVTFARGQLFLQIMFQSSLAVKEWVVMFLKNIILLSIVNYFINFLNSCKAGWYSFADRCYKFVMQNKIQYWAEDYCLGSKSIEIFGRNVFSYSIK